MAATAGLNHQQQQHQQHQQLHQHGNSGSRMLNFAEEGGKPGAFPQAQWIPDERDAFISWLRSEFAAANAIIDAMCQHLTSISGGPGEYDPVLNRLRQRRFNWSSILHMQQYFSVEEVVLALQQVGQQKRRQMQAPQRTIGSGGDIPLPLWPDRRSAPASPASGLVSETSTARRGDRDRDIEIEEHFNGKLEDGVGVGNGGVAKVEDLGAQEQSSHEGHAPEGNRDFQDDKSAAAATAITSATSAVEEDEGRSVVINKIKPPKCFQSQEVIDSRMDRVMQVNVVEGLKLWEEVFNALECDHIASLMNADLDGVGRKIEIGGRGHKIIGGKRFLKAKGGADHQQPDDDRSSPEEGSESLPGSLEFIANRLLECQIIAPNKRPDSFIVSFLGEEGYLLPQIHNQEFEHPYCILFLQSECSIVFGRYINMDSPGDFRSQFKLSVGNGTVLSLQNNAAKIARYAVPALPSKRCCIVIGKMLTKRPSRNSGFGQRLNANNVSNNHNNVNSNGNNMGGLITRPATSPNFNMNSPHLGPPPSPNGSSQMQHGFPPPQGGPAYPPLPVPLVWSPVGRPPRLMTGTGVFLPYHPGPGRPGGANRCRQQPFLQKTNSFPASFRSQNGISSSSSPLLVGKGVDEPGNVGLIREGVIVAPLEGETTPGASVA